jgi:hypothetical protein
MSPLGTGTGTGTCEGRSEMLLTSTFVLGLA